MKRSQVISGLMAAFSCFVILSWVLLFRDERALIAIPSFIPSLQGVLDSWRQLLLENGLNTLPTLLFAGVAAGAFGCYFFSLKTQIDKRSSIFYALLFQVIIFFSYPILSTDIFSYIFSDRVFTEYGQNVWEVTPDTFSNDPYEPLADWKDQTKVYGALNQIIYLPASYLGRENLVWTLVLYKLTALLFAGAMLYIFTKLAEGYTHDPAKAVRLLFWNPLFVLEIAGSGHNDIAMLFFFLVALFLYWKKMWWLAGVALALSVQVKLIMGVFLIFAVVELVRKKNFRAVTEVVAAFGVVNLLAFWYMKVNPLEFLGRVLYNTSVYWQSLPALVHRFWEGEKSLFGPALLFILAAFLYYQWRRKLDALFVTAAFLLVYLLFFSAAYWNWYVLWVLVAVPFIKNKWLQTTILTFSFTSLLAYPLLWVSLRFGYNQVVWSFVYYLWIAILPLTIGLLIKKRPSLSNYFLKP